MLQVYDETVCTKIIQVLRFGQVMGSTNAKLSLGRGLMIGWENYGRVTLALGN